MSDDKDTTNSGTAQEKSFFERAQEAIESAVELTVEAVKEHPLAASAIAAGAAAAVAGAAYGASKLLDKDDEDSDGSVKG